MEDMLKQLLGGDLDALIGKLTSVAGFGGDQASSFMGALIEKVGGLIGAGSLDIGSLLGNFDLGALLQQLNPGELAEKASVTTEQAQQGLELVVPDIVEKAKGMLGGGGEGGGLDDLLGGLGDMLK